MTPEQVSLVKDSWSRLAGDPEGVAALFYAKLFAKAPAVRSLFPDSMVEQGRKLTSMLATAVKNLDKLDEIRPAIEACGKRHIAYGALPEHYPVVGETLLETLAEGLGPEFTSDVEAAWSEVYQALSSVMIDAAEAA